MKKAIVVKNLSKTFEVKAKKKEKYLFTAVDNVSFEVNQGEIIGFIGPNGAGKSTTIKMLTCLTKPTGGDAFIGENSITKQPGQVKALIGVSPQLGSNLIAKSSSPVHVNYY